MKSTELDAVTACWIDEMILREEPLLQSYWNYRNTGRLLEATQALDRNNDGIIGAIEVMSDVSQRCALLIKAADLYTMGLGKDATQITNRPDCYQDTDNRISIIFNDIGCWPDAPGGVSNCRRDLVDGLSTIRNHVIGETANVCIFHFSLDAKSADLKTGLRHSQISDRKECSINEASPTLGNGRQDG